MIVLVTLTTSSIVFAGAKGKRSTKAIMPFKGRFETTTPSAIATQAGITY